MFAHASSINEKNKTIDMKFISWNVNGLRACKDKGFIEAFRRLDADFFCLQETKMQEGQLDLPTGTTPRKKVIQARPSIHATSR